MDDKKKVHLLSEASRSAVIGILRSVPLDGSFIVEIKKQRQTRRLIQNDKMWAMLSDVASQVDWHGLELSPDDWKDMFTAALKECRVVPNLSNNGFVVLGLRTSKMTIGEMCDLIELIYAFGSERGVVWSEKAREE